MSASLQGISFVARVPVSRSQRLSRGCTPHVDGQTASTDLVVCRGEARSFLAVGWARPVGSLDFDGVDLSWSKHIGAEDNPFSVRRKGYIWFEPVIVLGQIAQLFSLQLTIFWHKEIYPLAISRSCNAIWTTTIASKELSIR